MAAIKALVYQSPLPAGASSFLGPFFFAAVPAIGSQITIKHPITKTGYGGKVTAVDYHGTAEPNDAVIAVTFDPGRSD